MNYVRVKFRPVRIKSILKNDFLWKKLMSFGMDQIYGYNWISKELNAIGRNFGLLVKNIVIYKAKYNTNSRPRTGCRYFTNEWQRISDNNARKWNTWNHLIKNRRIFYFLLKINEVIRKEKAFIEKHLKLLMILLDQNYGLKELKSFKKLVWFSFFFLC